MKKTIKVARPLFPEKEKLLKDIKSILESGRLMKGPFTSLFEREFAAYCKSRYAVSVNSCTTALEIILRYIDVSGQEVIIPTNTFIATPNAVIFAGGKPVFADIKEGTYFLDSDEVRRHLSKKTRAVIAVHMAGLVPPEIEDIKSICDKAGVPLIEDCAHAVGASYNDRMAGTFGLAGCFSFYPTKIMTTGTGGMITTDDRDLAGYAKSARFHGAGKGLSDITNIGNDWFMDEIGSAIGLNQLKHLGYFLKSRSRIAAIYDKLVAKTDVLKKFPVSRSSRHAYYKYPVQVTAPIDVEGMKKDFQKKHGFELESLYWPTCHLQPVYRKMFNYKRGLFPVAEAVLSKQITLPVHAAMTAADACSAFEMVVTEINSRMK